MTSHQRFVSATSQLQTGAPVVAVMGEVDLATASALEDELLRVAEDAPDELIVDLTACSFLDVRALGALFAARARLEQSNGRLALVLSNPNVMRIFQITRSEALFDMYPSVAAVVNGNGNGTRNGNGNGNGNGHG